MGRQLYICQKCGEQCDDGDKDHTGRHTYCGGQLDPNGETEDEGVALELPRGGSGDDLRSN